MSSPDLILASASPRRLELLSTIGVTARACPVDLDETPQPDEPAYDYVVRLAREKALAGQRALATTLPVLGGDTALSLDGQILGKPIHDEQARSWLRRLSGRSHQVISAVAVTGPAGLFEACVISDVHFRVMEAREINAYVGSGEGRDKAGGYALQGGAAMFVSRIEGSWSGIVGLPLCETAQLLARQGVTPWMDDRDGEREGRCER
ncbi:Maf family protein [Kushneria marisflavi]|uniref:dTTP/UTP pyrophosphatase n=1 Tax=Kushneria marisflavi TaxID=157779 RepID=A0A240URX1_9GAMM|nr:nucleoside triphosphate pyrophosphatase [Kushneria marisflavi]ART64234.1 septum formation protein Maf [Kushneria marisflavi]RKD76694.1 septum formation protein [Kushneria marisflavi]